MFYNNSVTALETLKYLTSQMHLEPAEDAGCPQLSPKHQDDIHISHAMLPNGRQIKLLKSLLTSACERNCYYCPFRAGRDFRRATFKPEDFAQTFMALHQAGAVEGLFISSGILNGGIATQDKLIAAAEILRKKYQFKGYIHLKIMPGAERAQVEAAMRLADRVSVNLEAPNTLRLEKLAPRKQFLEELLQPLRWIEEIRRSQPSRLGWNGRWPSSVTQFVVGAVGENDLELLQTTTYLYQQLRLRRAYYSRFSPIRDTPFENQPAESQLRENRLYQASFLLRDYGFNLEDMPFDATGNLPRHADPKKAWADMHLANHPLEINRSSREELLRIPGIGPKSVDAILKARRSTKLNDLDDLRKIGVNPSRAAPYILLDGRRPAYQSQLF